MSSISLSLTTDFSIKLHQMVLRTSGNEIISAASSAPIPIQMRRRLYFVRLKVQSAPLRYIAVVNLRYVVAFFQNLVLLLDHAVAAKSMSVVVIETREESMAVVASPSDSDFSRSWYGHTKRWGLSQSEDWLY